MKLSTQSSTQELNVKMSKTDQPVPVLGGVHLHSIYNPDREAEGFISANEKNFKEESQVLIFGLGFGYHISKLEARLKALHGDEYRIFVIEPSKELYQRWKDLRPTSFSSRVKIVQFENVKDFFKDKELVEFLSDKPHVLPHPASFQLNESFYKSFMSFHYPTTIDESQFFVESEEYSKYLSQAPEGESTEEIFQRVKGKSFLQKHDFLTLALSEMVTEK
jgi:hypothetical protein